MKFEKSQLEKLASKCNVVCGEDSDFDLSEWLGTLEDTSTMVQQFQEAFKEIIPDEETSRAVLKHIKENWWPDAEECWEGVDLG